MFLEKLQAGRQPHPVTHSPAKVFEVVVSKEL